MDTIIGTTKSLREMRVPQRLFPLWDIELLFQELRDKTQNQSIYVPFASFRQYEDLVQLWLMMYGQTGVFAFDCPWDDSRLLQPIGTGDGSTYIFTIYRTWGLGSTATAAAHGQTALLGEYTGTGTYVRILATLAAAAEFGMFSQLAVGGTMYNRSVLSPTRDNENNALEIIYQCTVAPV